MIATLLLLLRELFLATLLQLPLGIVVGAATERLCRRGGYSYAGSGDGGGGGRSPRHYGTSSLRLRNIVVKIAVAYPSAYYLIRGNSGVAVTAVRMTIFLVGLIVGTALQPVGLTGGIATGKSTVSGLLLRSDDADDGQEEGDADFIVIDVDKIAHDILLPPSKTKLAADKGRDRDSVYDRLVSEFGTDILSEDKTTTTPHIDRRKLGDVVFKDGRKRKKLNSITHPKIIEIMLRRIVYEGLNLGRFFSSNRTSTKTRVRRRSRRRRVVCADVPLLFEGGLPMRLLFGSTIVVVACDPKSQLERLKRRNQDLTEEQCRQRIASQIPVEVKARMADVVIRNDGNLEALKGRVGEVKGRLTDVVAGSERGAELWWLVVGIGGLLLVSRSSLS